MAEFDALWNYDDPSGTEKAFRRVLEGEATAWDQADRAELLTQIARTLGLQRRFDEARTLLNTAETFSMGSPTAEARVLLERGRVHNSSGDKNGAIPQFEQALSKADEAGEDFFAVDAIHMLAIASPPEKQMHWHKEGIRRAEVSADPKTRGWLGSLYNNLAWSLHEAGMFGEALTVFQKALAFRIEQNKEGPIRIARWCVARCLRSVGRLEEALQLQLELQKDCASSNAPDGYVEEEIAECLFALGQQEEAKPHFSKALLLLEKALSEQGDTARLTRLRELSS